MTNYVRQFNFITRCEDPQALRTLIANASGPELADVRHAAFRKLISIVPGEAPGTLEHDFWRTIQAFEHILSVERGKTTRLARTRQKEKRVGAWQVLVDWAFAKQDTEGFGMLLERNMPELTGEAIVLRHPDIFKPDVLEAAKARLNRAGVDVERLPRTAHEVCLP